MVIKRPTPRNLDLDVLEQLTNQAAEQEVRPTFQRSTDPENFPVFDYTPGEEYLVYVPKHTVTDAEGNVSLRMDMPLLTTLQPDKNTFIRVRSVHGLKLEALGLDGTDPIQDNLDISFKLAKAEIDYRAAMLPGSPSGDDKSNEQVKEIRSQAFRNKPLDSPDRHFTFPIVVIEAERNNNNRLLPKVTKTAEGKPELSFRAMWYSISERMYERTWADVFEAASDEIDSSTIGGHFYAMSYGKKDEKGQPPSKRDGGREFKVVLRQINKMDQAKQQFNKMTEEWTPAKAMQTVINNQIPDMDWYRGTVDKMVIDMQTKIDMYEKSLLDHKNSGGAAVVEGQGVTLDALKGGGASGAAGGGASGAAGGGASGAALGADGSGESYGELTDSQ